MSDTTPIPTLELWAQYHTVGPDGYGDSDGEVIAKPTVEVAEALVNHPAQLQDICWINFSVFVDDDPAYKVEESIIAVSQKRLNEVKFKPVSEVVDSGRISKHTATWVGNLALRKSTRLRETPDRFEDLLILAHRSDYLKSST